MIIASRRTQAELKLAQILRDASGFDLFELNPDASFLELGFDSLFLIQFSQRIKSNFGVKVTFRQLIEEFSTIRGLVDHLAARASDAVLQIDSAGTRPSDQPGSISTQPEAKPSLVDNAAGAVDGQLAQPVITPDNSPAAAIAPDLPPPRNAAEAPSQVAQPFRDNTAPNPLSLTPSSSTSGWLSSQAQGPSLQGLEQLIAQQNQLMALQLQLLRERRSAAPGVGSLSAAAPFADDSSANTPKQPPSALRGTSTSLANSPAPAMPAPKMPAPKMPAPAMPGLGAAASAATAQKKIFERFGPYKPIRRSASGGLTESQQKHLDQFISRFTRRTAKSRTHAQKHRDHFADPRGVAGYRRIWKSMVYQIAVERSAGSKLWDIDGNEYIDIAMGFGLNLFGQSPSFITQALQQQLTLGVEVGPQSPLAGEVARMLCQLSRMDRATFCNTGSEAVMAAMRIARTVTGKTKCVFFNKDYHGNFDQVLLRSSSTNGKAASSPAAPGVPEFYADNTIVLEYGSPESLKIIEAHADEIAAVLVEPVQSADPDFQPRDFMQSLRKLTQERNIAMVMDEVISGFRAAPGGAQEYFDVWGDMATYGKVLGGGLPIGALAGKSEWMNALDGGTWRYEDDSEPEADMTFFAGTFVRHPLAMAAANQVLKRVLELGPELQNSLNLRTAAMTDEINQFFIQESIPIRLARFTSLFRFIFPPDLEYADMLYFHLLDRGIFTRGWGDNCFLSTEHTEADVRRIIDAVKSSCLELREAGFLPDRSDKPNDDNPTSLGTSDDSGRDNQSGVKPSGQNSGSKLAAGTSTASVALAMSPDASAIAVTPTVTTSTVTTPLKLCSPIRVSCIEEIQEEGDLPPLFCMPAADGLTLVYHELSNCLGKNQPVYGLNSPGVYGEPVPETIEEMATRFVEDILEVRPQGPYLLAGYCSGGTIALEVAQQLIARGEQVAFLAGVETYNWCTAQSSQLNNWIRFVYSCQRIDFHFRNFWLLPWGEKRKFLNAKLAATAVRTKVWRGMLSNLFKRRQASPAARSTSAPQINYAEIWRQHDAQADRYRPQTYPGKMYLFRPRKDYLSYVAKVELQARRGVEIIRLPVYPAGLMVSPFVSQLAEMFEQAIRESLLELDAYPESLRARAPSLATAGRLQPAV